MLRVFCKARLTFQKPYLYACHAQFDAVARPWPGKMVARKHDKPLTVLVTFRFLYLPFLGLDYG